MAVGQVQGEAYRRELRGLRERVSHLEAENARLREILIPDYQMPSEWHLTGSEARVLSYLLSVPIGTKDGIYASLYQLKNDNIEIKIIDVFICKLRAKLPECVKIETVWGQGYRLVKTPHLFSLIEKTNVEATALVELLDDIRANPRRPFEPIWKREIR